MLFRNHNKLFCILYHMNADSITLLSTFILIGLLTTFRFDVSWDTLARNSFNVHTGDYSAKLLPKYIDLEFILLFDVKMWFNGSN